MEEETSYGEEGGFGLSQAFGAVLAVVMIAILVIIAISIMGSLSEVMEESNQYNTTDEIITQFSDYSSLVGLVGIIVFLGLVIGVLVAPFSMGSSLSSGSYSDDEDEDEEELDDFISREENISETKIINTSNDSDSRVINKKW